MNFNEFHNAVRILCWNIERNEVGFMTSGQWLDFQRNPNGLVCPRQRCRCSSHLRYHRSPPAQAGQAGR